jgi:hypothetical protein
MGVRRRGSAVPLPGWDGRQWSQYEQDMIVTPDDGTVTPGSLAPETVTQIGDTATTAADAALASHVAQSDPHSQYAQHAEVTSAQAAAESSAATALAGHVAGSDPHPVYLQQSEGDARYRELSDPVTYTEITGKPAALALIFSGTGTPEGSVAAGIGATYHRTDGGAGTCFYVKESGGSSNSGWVAK